MAANKNIPSAQLFIGYLYYSGCYVERNINRAIYWISRSCENNFTQAHFSLGFLYQDGKYLKRDMKKAIYYYKEASSFNHQYAKNNLGIIYKYGLGVEANSELAKIYFEEAIRQKDDPVSMYNLAHIYIYEECTNESVDKSIELLARSSNKGFSYSKKLLRIAIFIKNNKNIEKIKTELLKYIKYENESSFMNNIDQFSFEKSYLRYKDIDFLYDIILKKVIAKDIYTEKIKPNTGIKVTEEFYKGFGINLN